MTGPMPMNSSPIPGQSATSWCCSIPCRTWGPSPSGWMRHSDGSTDRWARQHRPARWAARAFRHEPKQRRRGEAEPGALFWFRADSVDDAVQIHPFIESFPLRCERVTKETSIVQGVRFSPLSHYNENFSRVLLIYFQTAKTDDFLENSLTAP